MHARQRRGERVPVPGEDPGEDGGYRKSRPRERQDHPSERLTDAGAIDHGRLIEFLRYAVDDAAQRPDGEGQVEYAIEQDQLETRVIELPSADRERLSVEKKERQEETAGGAMRLVIVQKKMFSLPTGWPAGQGIAGEERECGHEKRVGRGHDDRVQHVSLERRIGPACRCSSSAFRSVPIEEARFVEQLDAGSSPI